MRPSAGAVSSTRPHPDSSFTTTTCRTGHVTINHSVISRSATVTVAGVTRARSMLRPRLEGQAQT
eukprot:scaffold66417_cov20-Attheya_sp.AAC.1